MEERKNMLDTVSTSSLKGKINIFLTEKLKKVVKTFGDYFRTIYLCTRFTKQTGCSAVRLAHLLWEQGVVGSNPATPTRRKQRENAQVMIFEMAP